MNNIGEGVSDVHGGLGGRGRQAVVQQLHPPPTANTAAAVRVAILLLLVSHVAAVEESLQHVPPL